MISVNCSACGKTLRVRDEFAGKTGKCPCGGVIKIPAAGAVSAAPPPARPSGFAKPEPAAAPARQGKLGSLLKNKRLVMGLAVALLFVVVVMGVAMLFRGGGASFKDDAAYLPDNTQMIVSIRSSEALNSPLYLKIREEVPSMKEGMSEVTRQSGLDPAGIERMTLAFDPAAGEPVGIVRFLKPVQFSDIRSARKVPEYRLKVDYEETKVKDRSIFQETYEPKSFFDEKAPVKRRKGTSYGMADSRLTLVGDDLDQLKKILERGQPAKLADGLQQGIDQVDFSKTFALVINVKGLMADARAAQQLKRNMGRMPGADAIFSGIEVVAAEVAMGSDVNARAVLICKDAATAGELKKTLDGLLALGKTFLGEAQDVPKEVGEVLNVLKLDTKDNQIIITATLPGATVTSLAKTAFTPQHATFNTKGEFKKGPPDGFDFKKDFGKK